MNTNTKNNTLSDEKLAASMQAMEFIPELFYCADASGKILYVNAYGRKLLGLNSEQLASSTVLDIHPELAEKRWGTAVQAARDKGHWIIQCQQKFDSNAPSKLEIAIGHQHTDDGDERFYCLARVASRLNKSEELLNFISQATAGHSGEGFLKSLMEQLAKVMHVRIAFVTECLDQPPTRVRMLAFWCDGGLADNLEYDLTGTPCDTVINGRKKILVGDKLGETYPKEDGFAESYYGFPIYDSEGKDVIGHIAILDNNYLTTDGIDCTVFEILAERTSVELQRRRAENALKEREEKYRLLVNNQTDLIMQIDSEAKLLFASPSCVNRLGKAESELTGSDFFKYIHHSEIKLALRTWKSALSKHKEQSCELRVLTTKGWCWFIWSLKVVNTSDSLEVIAVGRDISKRRRAEDQTRTTIQQLAHVGRLSSMGEMASGIAHELNQPLTAILSFSQASIRMLDNNISDLNEYKKIQERIAVNAELAGEIIRRVRSFVRKGEASKKPMDLDILFDEVINLLRTESRHAEINISLDFDSDLPTVVGDAIQIQQVMINLVRNAIEAIKDHNNPIRNIIISAYNNSKDGISIEVSDTGPGIPEDISKHLFETFTTTKAEGLGIGLSICHTIIENHDAELKVKSSSKKGTTFIFTLPLQIKE